MKLSQYGCMPKLVDYLRVNEDDEILEIIGKNVKTCLIYGGKMQQNKMCHVIKKTLFFCIMKT